MDDVVVETESLGFIVPKQKIIKYALEWASRQENGIICACQAGISRSSSMAVLIKYMNTRSVEKAISILTEDHWPNKLIIKYGAEILEESNLIKEVHQFKRRLRAKWEQEEQEMF